MPPLCLFELSAVCAFCLHLQHLLAFIVQLLSQEIVLFLQAALLLLQTFVLGIQNSNLFFLFGQQLDLLLQVAHLLFHSAEFHSLLVLQFGEQDLNLRFKCLFALLLAGRVAVPLEH